MNLDTLITNLTNPALLFFFMGIIAVRVKSTLSLPEGSSKFISIYLLFSIGFKGGQELSHGTVNSEMLQVISIGLLSAALIPILTFFVLRSRVGVANASAIAASYGSVSAVTFITAIAFLEQRGLDFGGHMVALMAMMEAPAIVVGVLLMKVYGNDGLKQKLSNLLKHAVTNGSVFLLLGATIIGFIASEEAAQGIAPFTTDIFKGFLVLFLLDMGIKSGKEIGSLWRRGPAPILWAIFAPLIIGSTMAFFISYLSVPFGDKVLLTVLIASASYIAVPASMKIAIPEANPALYTPMALAITFPVNIMVGIPLYASIIA
jgi:hypothetical protein